MFGRYLRDMFQSLIVKKHRFPIMHRIKDELMKTFVIDSALAGPAKGHE